MKILDRYILKEIAGFFFISLFAFIGLLLTIRMLKLASLIIHKGVALGQIVTVFLSVVPTFLEIAIPMSALLGVMLAFARLSADSEIIVIRASGIGLKKLVSPVLIFGVLVICFGLYVSHQLKPWGYRKLSQSLFEIAQSKSTAGLNEGVFNDLGNITLYAETIDHSSGALSNVLIDDRRDEEVRQVITAKTGSILSDSVEQTVIFNLKEGDIHELVESGYIHTSFDSNNLRLKSDDLYGESISKSRRSRELYNSEILSTHKRYEELLNLPLAERIEKEEDLPESELTDSKIKRRMRSLIIEIDKRVSMPFAALLLALVAMPLGIQPPRTQRTWGAGLSAFIGLLVFLFYYGTLTICVALVEDNVLPSLLGVWLPNIIAGAISIYMLRKMSSEKWQSVAQGIEVFFTKISQPIARRIFS